MKRRAGRNSNGLQALNSRAITFATSGQRALVQHKGQDGSQPVDRIARHGINRTATAEVISFGPSRARDVVIELVIDEGVKDRGHRKILLDPELRYAGAACGPHESTG